MRGQGATFKLRLEDGVDSRQKSAQKASKMAERMCAKAWGRKELKGGNAMGVKNSWLYFQLNH